MTVLNGFSLMVWICTVRSFSLAVSNGGGRTSPVTFSSNDCFEWVLIDVWKHIADTFSSSSFKWGEGRGGGGHWPK